MHAYLGALVLRTSHVNCAVEGSIMSIMSTMPAYCMWYICMRCPPGARATKRCRRDGLAAAARGAVMAVAGGGCVVSSRGVAGVHGCVRQAPQT